MTYHLCAVENHLGRWKQRKFALLPENLAVKGKGVRSYIQRNLWDDGWVVVEVFAIPKDLKPHSLDSLWEESPP